VRDFVVKKGGHVEDSVMRICLSYIPFFLLTKKQRDQRSVKNNFSYKYLGQRDRPHFSVLVIRFKYVVEFNATVFGIPCLLITYYEGICLWQ